MPSEDYVVARTVLLDALEALERHRDSLILVGAQAVYVHTGEADLAVAEHTTDADIAIDPRHLQPDPELASTMRGASFQEVSGEHGRLVGIWSSRRSIGGIPTAVNVDLLVPAALGGVGRRAARIPPHERGVALKVRGLEAAIVDNHLVRIAALEDGDDREFEIHVSGPAALLVAKLTKLSERSSEVDRRSDRLKAKDALDVLRLLRAVELRELAEILADLADDELAAPVTRDALDGLPGLFGTVRAPGSSLAAAAAAPEPPEVIAASCAALCSELMDALEDAK